MATTEEQLKEIETIRTFPQKTLLNFRQRMEQ